MPPANVKAPYPTNLSSIAGLFEMRAFRPRGIRVRGLSSFTNTTDGEEILSNALRRRTSPSWGGGGFSLGVDLGASHTGLVLGKGFCPRPLTVLELRGQKLERRLLEIDELEEVDELIIGLPKSHDGKGTPQSNKVRSSAGRIAVQAAERYDVDLCSLL
ncbi:hypothetical protein KSP40_PGU015129 [Platanthera guangdongensis]|uniref:YqgF/RNase H-like domain-containing protein n=1 Tax=Platanthera guangdongensis TaxID=2320717 RepID=A0ABR2LCP0_9ASPA